LLSLSSENSCQNYYIRRKIEITRAINKEIGYNKSVKGADIKNTHPPQAQHHPTS